MFCYLRSSHEKGVVGSVGPWNMGQPALTACQDVGIYVTISLAGTCKHGLDKSINLLSYLALITMVSYLTLNLSNKFSSQTASMNARGCSRTVHQCRTNS